MTYKILTTTNAPSPRGPADVLFQARLTVTPPNKGGRRRPRRFVEPMRRIGERIGEKVLWELLRHAGEKVVDAIEATLQTLMAALIGPARVHPGTNSPAREP